MSRFRINPGFLREPFNFHCFGLWLDLSWFNFDLLGNNLTTNALRNGWAHVESIRVFRGTIHLSMLWFMVRLKIGQPRVLVELFTLNCVGLWLKSRWVNPGFWGNLIPPAALGYGSTQGGSIPVSCGTMHLTLIWFMVLLKVGQSRFLEELCT